jgi:Domain of unknown function (DUF6429)
MKLDTDHIDDAVLALLQLGLHDGRRAWKGFDWTALRRLHEKGFIADPVNKAKSVIFHRRGAGTFGKALPGAVLGGIGRGQIPRCRCAGERTRVEIRL